ncbi:MAG: hypothetical protein KatS3mg103_0815 [Phycisphaerales bacterium]|nr:MAG: hypothetical protein KatS3mg103_0815 [Phycisphaerales bacterium]
MANLGSFDLGTARQLVGKFADEQAPMESQVFSFMNYNTLTLDLRNAKDERVAEYPRRPRRARAVRGPRRQDPAPRSAPTPCS